MAMRSMLPLLLVGMLGFPFFFNACSEAATFTIHNNCPYTIWPATLTGSGSQLSSTGFELASGASNSIDVPNPWSGRIWARTSCSSGGQFKCVTGDCGSGSVECNGAGGASPASLVELTLGGTDFYDVSLVDGFNLPVNVAPQGGSSGCNPTSCPADVNRDCPFELAVKGSDGGVVGCQSACVVFNKPEYCCTGEYGTPDKCQPSSYSKLFKDPEYCCTGEYGTPDKCQPSSYSKLFKDQCPQAYSYAYDDKSSTFTCSGGANYLITFCP